MKSSIAIIGVLAVLSLSACATRALAPTAPMEQPAPPGQRSGVEPYSAPGIGGGAPNLLFGESDQAVQPPAATAAPADSGAANAPRLVIQNADLSIVVKDVQGRVKAIQDMATRMGGFIVSVNVYETYASNGNQVPQAQIVVRVPSDKLEDALTEIKGGTVDVQNENRSGTDVTDQYVDLQSRLKAKQAAEEQLLVIMKDAKRTEDVLAVYSQLQQVQSDIEVLKGQIKYYEQSAAMSAITVNVIAEETVKPLEVGGWKPEGVARDAIQSLIYFWQDFVDFLIRFVLYILPVLLTLAIPLFLIFLVLRWIIRKTRKPRPAPVVEEPKK